MREAGFQVLPVRRGFVWDFAHPDVPRHFFSIADRPVENYSAALPRLIRELAVARRNLISR